jgi:membrane-associated protein
VDINSIISIYTNFLSQISDVTLVVLVICLLGEVIGIGVPYLIETVWLVAGYNATTGINSVASLFLLLVVAQAGRMAGAMVLYFLSMGGSAAWKKMKGYLRVKNDVANSPVFKWFSGKNWTVVTPFSVALGRLLWMRLPLTIYLGTKRDWKTLLLGILISSALFDCVPIIIGAVIGKTVLIDSNELLLYSLGGLTVFYLACFGVRKLIQYVRRRRAFEAAE